MRWKKFSLKIEFTTPYLTPLQADTIFGEFCWHYRFLYGEDELKKLLRDETSNPAVVFSDAFPEGLIPFPKLPLKLSFGSIDEYSRVKRIKKQRYLKISTLRELLPYLPSFLSSFKESGKILSILLKELEEKEERSSEQLTTVHVSVNRILGTAHQGRLFHLKETFTRKGYRFVLYGIYDPDRLSISRIKEIFRFMGLDGFGAKRSAGKGKFCVVGEVREDWGALEGVERGKRWFISLSTGLPQRCEVKGAYAEFFTKFPKHGREVARPEIFKNPLILSRPGSLFEVCETEKEKPFYGSLVEISALKGHVHSRLIVPLFVG